MSSIYSDTSYLRVEGSLFSSNTGRALYGGAITVINGLTVVVNSSGFKKLVGE